MKIYEEILKNADLGIEAIDAVKCRVQDERFLNELAKEKRAYVSYRCEMERELSDSQVKDAVASKFQKAMMKFGTKMNTVFDSSNTNIAEMMIEGTNMGINDIQKEINRMNADKEDVPPVAYEYIEMMQQNVDELRNYL